jgi:hypothetical protein
VPLADEQPARIRAGRASDATRRAFDLRVESMDIRAPSG